MHNISTKKNFSKRWAIATSVFSLLLIICSCSHHSSEYSEAMSFYDSLSAKIDTTQTLEGMSLLVNEYADRSSNYTTDILSDENEKKELEKKSQETVVKLMDKLDNLSKINGLDNDGFNDLNNDDDETFSIGF